MLVFSNSFCSSLLKRRHGLLNIVYLYFILLLMNCDITCYLLKLGYAYLVLPQWCCYIIITSEYQLHQLAIINLAKPLSSGNRTPGSRFYSDLLDTSACIHKLVLKRLQVESARLKCRRLTDGSFQLTHMSCDVHAVQLIEPWRPKRRQNIITALTT